MKVIWKRGRAAQLWQFAEGVWIPKEEDSKDIGQFRIISPLSVEGKIFFSIVDKWLVLLKKGYMDTVVQKGGIPVVQGCLEHKGVLRRTRVIWLRCG